MAGVLLGEYTQNNFNGTDVNSLFCECYRKEVICNGHTETLELGGLVSTTKLPLPAGLR